MIMKTNELQSEETKQESKGRFKSFLKRHRKGLIVLLILLVIVGIVAFWTHKTKVQMQEMMAAAAQPDTAQVERRSLVESISATGTVVSAESKTVTIPVNGVTVEKVNVEVGDSVEAGDILCVMDTTDLEEDLANARLSYEAAQKKMEIELASAQRSLSEAETSREIEIERANQDESDAYNDYLRSITDVEEAEDDYQEAQQETMIKNGEYELAKQQMEDKKEEMEDLAKGAGKSSAYESAFAKELEMLKSTLSQSLTPDQYDLGQVYIANPNLAIVLNNVIKDETAKASMSGVLAQYQGGLLSIQSEYAKAAAADQKYQEAQADYQELQQEVSTWEQKYNSAKQSESSLESAYEQSIDASESKQDAYVQKQRNAEDAVRNNDSTVSNKTDSLSTSEINASTTGLTEEQQIRDYEKQIADCTVEAPISGIITSLGVETGDTYNGAEIAVIENVNAYEIEAEIDEYDINKIKEGQKVVIRTNGTGDEELEGTVSDIAPRATSAASGAASTGSSVTYKVTISVDSSCEDIRMDMTAKLSIIIDSCEDVLTVPYDAVQEDEEGNFYVEVQEDVPDMPQQEDEGAVSETPEQKEPAADQQGQQQNGTAGGQMPQQTYKRIMVEKGIESDYYVEVFSDEITEGMQVIVPKSDEDGLDFMGMMMEQGAMGGF